MPGRSRLLFRARTQTTPAGGPATARAWTTTGDLRNRPENKSFWGWLMMTSMSPAVPVLGPDFGGLFTVTTVPFEPLTKPSDAVVALAWSDQFVSPAMAPIAALIALE